MTEIQSAQTVIYMLESWSPKQWQTASVHTLSWWYRKKQCSERPIGSILFIVIEDQVKTGYKEFARLEYSADAIHSAIVKAAG